MKKTLSLILAVIMLLGCMSVTAFAAENEAEITAEITAADFGYTMVIPTATTLTEANHENVLLGADGKVSIKDIKHPTDKVNVVYTVDLSNGNLTDGTNTIGATYKYKQGANEFAAIDGTTKVTVYENKTVTDSFVNVTADEDQWDAAPVGTYTATVTFNFEAKEAEPVAIVTIADILPDDFPTAYDTEWVDLEEGNTRAGIEGSNLVLGQIYVPLTSVLTEEQNGKYTLNFADRIGTPIEVMFIMSDNVLTKIQTTIFITNIEPLVRTYQRPVA